MSELNARTAHATGADGQTSRTSQPVAPREPTRQRRNELVVRQVLAIDSWTAALTQREHLASSTALSREERLVASRRLGVLRRAHAAVVERVAQALAADVSPMLSSGPVTAVLAHRHAWTLERLGEALLAQGVEILACTDNGADALGVVVAEQPDVLFTGERLAMLSGSELLADAALFAPLTLLAVQAGDLAAETRLLGAEAQLVIPHRQQVTDIALTLAAVAAQRAGLARCDGASQTEVRAVLSTSGEER